MFSNKIRGDHSARPAYVGPLGLKHIIALLLATVAAVPSFAADAPADVQTASAGSATKEVVVPEIVITGSRISRRDYKSDSPIVTIGSAALAAAGQPTFDRAIGELPQFSAAQGLSEVGDVQGDAKFTGGQSLSDLRGLGPNRALVLLDGHRLVSSSPDNSIDLNTIPTSVIENVEVITGGASATYGSDAIAGVLNFKLRHKFSGVELGITQGGTTSGDTHSRLLTAIAGGNFADDRGNAFVAFEYSERGLVRGADRPFFANIRNLARPAEGIIPGGLFGTAPTIAAVNSVLAGYAGTTPLAGTGDYLGAIGVNADGTIFTDLAGPNSVQNYKGLSATKGTNITANGSKIQVALGQYFALQVPLKKFNTFAHTDYKLTDNITAYGQFSFTESTARDETASGSTGPGKYFFIPVDNPFVTGNAALQTILASRPVDLANPTALTQPLALTKLLTVSGNRVLTYKYNVWQALAGFKGDIPGTSLGFDVYASFGRTLLNINETNATSKAAVATILNGTANYSGSAGDCKGYAWNPLGLDAFSPGCLQYTTRDAHNTNTITQKVVEASISGKIAPLPAGDLKFALGADYRGSNFDYRPDAIHVLDDSPTYDSTVAASGTQNVKELFSELLVPVFKDWHNLGELSLDLGYRRSFYTGFGSVGTWKADFNWQPISTFALRGGFQRAIRAPSLGELFAPTVTGPVAIGLSPNAGDPCSSASAFRTGATSAQVATLCQAQGVPAALYPIFTASGDSVFGTSGGNPKLTPEKANTFSLGFVWSPHADNALWSNIHLSVDYYKIKISDAVGNLALTDILPRCFNADGISNPSYSTANVYCQQITRDHNTGDIILGHEGNLNLAKYSTDGVDVQFDWSFGLGAAGLSDGDGKIKINSVFTYLHSFKVSSLPGSPLLDFAGSIGDSSVSPEISHPRVKANTTLGYAIGPVSTALHWRFIAAQKHADLVLDPKATTPSVPAYNYFDIDAHWLIRPKFELSLGLTNLTNKAPPFVSGQGLTTDSAAYDIIGRTYYASLKVKF